MTRSTNFEFMRDKCAELADEAAEIEGLVHRAGPQAINLLCAFGEKLLQRFVLENGGSVNRADSSVDGETIEFGQLIRQCESKSLRWHVPEPQRNLLDRLRSEGNKAKHRLNSRQRFDALSLLHDAWSVAGWAWKQLQWGNTAEQFVEPPKGGREFDDERRQKLEALKRVAEIERSCDVSGWICEDQRNFSAPVNFVGREFVFGKLEKFLASSECRVLLIQGQPGRGKTAIIQKFVSKGLPVGVTPFVFCFRDQTSQGEPKQWVRHLYASLVERWQLTPPDRAIQQADLEELVQQLRKRITEVAEKHRDERLLFVIDGVDEAGPAEKAVVSFLQSEFPKTAQVIATARPGHVSISPSTDGQSTIQRPLDLDDPDLWNKHQADGRRYVNETMPGFPSDAIDKVVQLSDGNFLMLLLICRELRDVPEATITSHLRELNLLKRGELDFVNELFKRSWQRLERLDADELDTVEKVATLLANARVPLSERIIRDTLRLRRADWVKVQQHFGEYLARSQWQQSFNAEPIDANGVRVSGENAEPVAVFRLFHQTFANFVRHHLNDDLAESKSQLADYCREQVKKPKPSYEYAYALRLGPTHVMCAAEHDPRHWNHLEELLTDLSFLEAKTQAGFVFELADDLASAWQTMPSGRPKRAILKLLEVAIRREILFIADHAADYPQGLFQCVWNAGWWYGNDQAVPYYIYNDSQESDKLQPPGKSEVGVALVQLLERWHAEKLSARSGFNWLRSRRPPGVHLGGGQKTMISACHGGGSWVDCSADGNRIVGGGDSSVTIWDAHTGKQIAQMPEWEGQQHSFQAAAVSPDGNVVIAAYGEMADCERDSDSQDDCPLLAVWDSKSEDVRTIAHGHEQRISDIAFSPDGSRFATASWDQTIRIWNAKTFVEVLVLHGCESHVDSLCYSSDGKRIVAGSDAIRIWDANSGQTIRVFAAGITNKPNCGNSNIAQLGGTLSKLVAEGLITKRRQGQTFVYELTEKGRALTDDEMAACEGANNAPKAELDDGEVKECHVCFSPDGTRIATNGGGRGVFILDADTGDILVGMEDVDDFVESICFSPDGSQIVSGSASSRFIWISDAASGVMMRDIWGHEVYSVRYSHDGKQILSGHSDGIRIWDAEIKGDERIRAGGILHSDCDIFFLQGGQKLVSYSDPFSNVWNGQSGVMLDSSIGQRTYSNNAKRYLEVASTDGKYWVVSDTATGDAVFALKQNRSHVIAKLSPDGERLALIALTRRKKPIARIFNVSERLELARLKGHEDEIHWLCFSDDGAQIATASEDQTMRIWNANTGDLLTLIQHDAAVHRVWFSPDRTQIVSFDEEAILRVFNVDDGIEQFVLDHHEQGISDLCFSPDGNRIVASGSDEIFVWNGKTGGLLELIRGSGDIHAIAADVEDTSFRLLVRDSETIVETASGEIVARYPGVMDHVATHPDGRTWAGAISDYLALIHLEGADHS